MDKLPRGLRGALLLPCAFLAGLNPFPASAQSRRAIVAPRPFTGAAPAPARLAPLALRDDRPQLNANQKVAASISLPVSAAAPKSRALTPHQSPAIAPEAGQGFSFSALSKISPDGQNPSKALRSWSQSGSIFDGSKNQEAHDLEATPQSYGHSARYRLLRQNEKISAHRKGLFRERAEKQYAYGSVAAASSLSIFTGFRYMTEYLPSAITSFFGIWGQYYLNDFLTPIGLAAAGYLIALKLAHKDYVKTAPDLRDGDLVREAAAKLPFYGVLGGWTHEFMQSDLFAGVAGFRLPGSFYPGDLIAYLLGGLAGAFLLSALWKPYANREGRQARDKNLRIGVAAAAAFVLPRLIAMVSIQAGVAIVWAEFIGLGILLIAGLRALHQSSTFD